MKITNRREIDVQQGTEEWGKIRSECIGGASEAPIMLGVSKYSTRNELLESRKGVKKEHSEYTKQIFAKGHELEEKARNILEIRMMEDWSPKVYECEVDDLKLIASLDGDNRTGCIFEHKSWNKDLAENVKKGVLEEHYSTQLDQQLLVSGANEVLFVVSDGTDENWEEMVYTSAPEKFQRVVDGWKQFQKDLETFEIKSSKTKVKSSELEFPVINYTTSDLSLNNISDYRKKLEEIKYDLGLIIIKDKTELDIANLESIKKKADKSRKLLKEEREKVVKLFPELNSFLIGIDNLDDQLQKIHSTSKKAFEEYKNKWKKEIIGELENEFTKFMLDLEQETGIDLNDQKLSESFYSAGKNKKNENTFREAMESDLAREKIELRQFAERQKTVVSKMENTSLFDVYIAKELESTICVEVKKELFFIDQLNDEKAISELKRLVNFLI